MGGENKIRITPDQRRKMEMTPEQKAVSKLFVIIGNKYNQFKNQPILEVLPKFNIATLGSTAENTHDISTQAALEEALLIMGFIDKHKVQTLAELLEAYQTSKSK